MEKIVLFEYRKPNVLCGAAGDEPGVSNDCRMSCDADPCHGGTCIERFNTSSHTCDCELTSYSGPACNEGEAATFRLQRQQSNVT